MTPQEVVARTIYGEAANELFGGWYAVGCVLINRLQDKRYPNTIEKVCLQRKQFSCWNDGKLKARTDNSFPPKMEKIRLFAQDFVDIANAIKTGEPLHGYDYRDITFGSCHYHASYIDFPASWGHSKVPVIAIGLHLFYNNIA